MIDLQKIVEEKIKKTERQILQAATERDESATPMESKSDQTRQIANQLYNSLLEERKALDEMKGILKNFSKIYHVSVEREPDGETKYLVVPNGLGGEWVGDVLLLSDQTPLAQKMKDIKVNEVFDLNGGKFKIERVEINS